MTADRLKKQFINEYTYIYIYYIHNNECERESERARDEARKRDMNRELVITIMKNNHVKVGLVGNGRTFLWIRANFRDNTDNKR